MADTYDVAIIGSGPGGYVAAIRAAQLGLRVAIVERELLGGICLNWGCIPTKALLRSAEIYHYMSHAKDYGLKAEGIGVDLTAVVKRSRGVAGQLNRGVTHLMKKNKVTVIAGVATLAAPGRVTVTAGDKTSTIEARHVILATGARARDLPFAQADGDRIWTYRHAMTPAEVPGELLVIGSGAIGCEFASFYSDLGAKVTIVETQDRVLPVEDAEVSDFVGKAFAKQGMTILAGHGVDALEVKPGQSVTATIRKPDGATEQRTYSHAIVAVGIVPNTDGLGLDALGVKTARGHVATDPLGRTSVAGVWAIGDITGPPWLAHKASHEGIAAAEAIAAELGNADVHPHAVDVRNIPGCTYARPQVASVGLTEAKAKEQGYAVRVGRFPFVGNGKAIALGEPEGFVKTVFDAATGELLGAHMVGAEVTELIEGYTVAKQLETTEAELIETVFPHPTLSEMMHESVLSAYGRQLHM